MHRRPKFKLDIHNENKKTKCVLDYVHHACNVFSRKISRINYRKLQFNFNDESAYTKNTGLEDVVESGNGFL